MLTNTIRKTRKQAKVGDTEDRISNLPDEVLGLILSFLPTKEAVKTTILSTRWKSIWSAVPTLYVNPWHFLLKDERFFSKESERKLKPRFLNFVDKALKGDGVHFLEKLSISGFYVVTFDGSDIESWITAAIKREVREVVLSCECVEPPPEFHQSLFSCNSLVVLRLHLKVVLNFPRGSTCFPNLKILNLQSVLYKDENSAQNLISGCPVLEDLVMIGFQFGNLRTLNVTSQSLKKLLLRFLVNYANRVQVIVIDAPALESLDIEDWAKQDYVVKDLSSTVKAKLHLTNISFGSATCLFKHMGTSNLKFLQLSHSIILPLSHGNSYNMLPIFHNLTYLEFFDAYNNILNWKLVIEFLRRSPVLEALVIEGFGFSDEEHGTSSQWDVPNCLHSHLKTIELKGNWEDYVEKVSYFLKNAKVLEKMTVKAHSNEAFKNIMINCEDLLNPRRGSMVCSDRIIVISFV